jgi:transposase
MKKYRNHTDDFKQQLILEIYSGIISVSQAAREHNISPSLIDRWRTQIHNGTMRPHKTKLEKQLEKELEQYKIKVAELTMANDFLKKLQNSTHMKKSNGYIVTPKKSDQSEEPAK